MMSNPSYDFSAVPEAAIKEMHRQGEACLNGTIQFALAAQTRATAFAGIFAAGAVALLVMAAASLTGDKPNLPLIGAGLAASLFLFAGASLCAWSSRPINFFVGGYEPQLLAVAAGNNEIDMIRGATEDLQVRIDANRGALEWSARRINVGGVLAVAAVPAFIAFLTVGRLF
jgi:hypothetical protein